MQFLHPIGLLAAAGIIIPLLIHLWKVNRGKTLKIGTIALLGKISAQHAKSRRLADWLLLTLRCLLILLLAFIIAQPYLNSKNTAGQVKGWILMEKQQLREVYQHHRPQIDSLLNKGFELRDFNPGFQPLTLQDTLNSDSGFTTNVAAASLLKQLNVRVPAHFPVHLYRDRRLNQMSQELPLVHFNLIWLDLQPSDTLSSWTSKLPVKTYEAHSSPAATWYSPVNQVKDSLTVLIAGNADPSDAAYIQAAVRAITDFSKIRLLLKPWSSSDFLALKPDLVFWLKDEALHPLLKQSWKSNARLFTYEKAEVQELRSTINFKTQNLANVPVIELKKRKAISSPKGSVAWSDGNGVPLLTIENKPDLIHYHFYSRFHPQWTDLVESEQFVKMLLPVVMGSTGSDADFGYEDHPADQRKVHKQQPLNLKGNTAWVQEKVEARESITSLFWVLAWLIFVLERILTFRNHKTPVA